MQLTQTVSFEVEAILYATAQRGDHGDDVMIDRAESIWFLGRDWSEKQLIDQFGRDNAMLILNYLDTLADGANWEAED
jgi:hypothetical protein